MNRQKRQQRQLHNAQMMAYHAQAANAGQQARLAAAHTQAVQHQQWMAACDHARAQAAAAPIKCPACGHVNAPRSASCATCASGLQPNRPYLPPPPFQGPPAQPSIAVKLWRGFRRLPTWIQVVAWLFVIGTFLSGLGFGDNQGSTVSPVTVTTSPVQSTSAPDSLAPQTETETTP